MNGYRIGKNSVIYIYPNVITAEEQKAVNYFVKEMGMKPIIRYKDVDKIRENNKKNGMNNELAKAKKEDLIKWFADKGIKEFTVATADAKYHAVYTDIAEMFAKEKFMRIKSAIRAQYPNYPSTEQ